MLRVGSIWVSQILLSGASTGQVNPYLADTVFFSRGKASVAQWLRICLPVQGTRVRALVREDPTCHGAAKPVCHNY